VTGLAPAPASADAVELGAAVVGAAAAGRGWPSPRRLPDFAHPREPAAEREAGSAAAAAGARSAAAVEARSAAEAAGVAAVAHRGPREVDRKATAGSPAARSGRDAEQKWLRTDSARPGCRLACCPRSRSRARPARSHLRQVVAAEAGPSRGVASDQVALPAAAAGSPIQEGERRRAPVAAVDPGRAQAARAARARHGAPAAAGAELRTTGRTCSWADSGRHSERRRT
jgi:hypothetical protein